jgi:hypothetical protein
MGSGPTWQDWHQGVALFCVDRKFGRDTTSHACFLREAKMLGLTVRDEQTQPLGIDYPA